MDLSLLGAEGGWQDFTLKGGEWTVLLLSAAAALLAIGVGFYLMRLVLAEDEGTPKMKEIALAIQEGAWAYLKRQFRTIAVILIPVAAIVFFTSTEIVKPDEDTALTFGLVRVLAHRRLRPRLRRVRPHRLHRHDAGDPRQRPHGRRGADGQHAPGAHRGLPHRRRRRHVHRRPRPARRDASSS